MKKQQPQVRLETELRELPRARAGEDFTRRLMRRLEERLEERHSSGQGESMPLPWLMTAAAVLLAALALSLVFVNQGSPEFSAAEQAEVRRLLEQHQRLQEELAAVRREVREAEPLLYLQGLPTSQGRSVDLVLEIPTTAQPASYRLD